MTNDDFTDDMARELRGLDRSRPPATDAEARIAARMWAALDETVSDTSPSSGGDESIDLVLEDGGSPVAELAERRRSLSTGLRRGIAAAAVAAAAVAAFVVAQPSDPPVEQVVQPEPSLVEVIESWCGVGIEPVRTAHAVWSDSKTTDSRLVLVQEAERTLLDLGALNMSAEDATVLDAAAQPLLEQSAAVRAELFIADESTHDALLESLVSDIDALFATLGVDPARCIPIVPSSEGDS